MSEQYYSTAHIWSNFPRWQRIVERSYELRNIREYNIFSMQLENYTIDMTIVNIL